TRYRSWVLAHSPRSVSRCRTTRAAATRGSAVGLDMAVLPWGRGGGSLRVVGELPVQRVAPPEAIAVGMDVGAGPRIPRHRSGSWRGSSRGGVGGRGGPVPWVGLRLSASCAAAIVRPSLLAPTCIAVTVAGEELGTRGNRVRARLSFGGFRPA